MHAIDEDDDARCWPNDDGPTWGHLIACLVWACCCKGWPVAAVWAALGAYAVVDLVTRSFAA